MDERRQHLNRAGAAMIPAVASSVPPPPPAPPGGLPGGQVGGRDLGDAMQVVDQALNMVWTSATDAAISPDFVGQEAVRERYRAAVVIGARAMVMAALGVPLGAVPLDGMRRCWIHGGTAPTGECAAGPGHPAERVL